jgi:hypothetical protein
MPTSRFVVVSAPLEERVAASVTTRVQGAVAGALRFRSDVNATLQREDLNDRATEALSHVTRPGGLPFVIFMLLIAVVALRALLFRIETRRILKAHRTHADGSAQAPTEHQHGD